MTLVHIKTDDEGKVIFFGWANPDQWKEGDTNPITGSKVYGIDAELFETLDPEHAIVNDGHVFQDPNYAPDPIPEPVSTPDQTQVQIAALTKQLMETKKDNTKLQTSVAALTKMVIANGKENA